MVRDNSEDKAERILSIYTKLTQGKVINKAHDNLTYSIMERLNSNPSVSRIRTEAPLVE